MTGARRTGNGIRWRHARQPQGYVPVTVVASEKQTPTVVIPAVRPEPPAQTEVITGGQQETERGPLSALGSFAGYEPEPIPDLDSTDPADRTAYLRELGGDEFLFESVVRDLDAEYLLDTSLPVPPRIAPETAPEPGPGADPPPAGEEAPAAAAPSSPEAPGPVSTEDEPVQDEPAGEQDCGEGSDS